MRTTALILSLVWLSACADVRWAKSGGDEAALEQDLKTCRTAAAEKAARMGTLGPPAMSDPRFGAPPGPTQMDIRVQERQIEERCMREKGYALVPVGT